MSQTWTDDCYAAGHVIATDMQAMENNFACLKSMFSGATAPGDPVAGMPWYDTTKKLLKHRDSADAAWRGIMSGDTSQKLWVYRNAAIEGWAIDSTVTDRVLALKGGTTYTTGGATAGSWTLPDCTLTAAQCATTATDELVDSSGDKIRILKETIYGETPSNYDSTEAKYILDWYDHASFDNSGGKMHSISLNASFITYTISGGGARSASAHNHGATYRPAAAVGTLQYVDV